MSELIYTRFTKLIINHFLSCNKSIPRRSDAEIHNEGQDSPLIKLINTIDVNLTLEWRYQIQCLMMQSSSQHDTSTTNTRRMKVRKVKLLRNQKSNMYLLSEVKEEKVICVQVTDTSSTQARKGKDIQSIHWDRLNITRESYRHSRLEQYKNYENISLFSDAVDKIGEAYDPSLSVEKDVKDSYAAETGLKLKGIATEDPTVQSLLDLRKGSKESILKRLRQERQAVRGEGSSVAHDKYYEFEDILATIEMQHETLHIQTLMRRKMMILKIQIWIYLIMNPTKEMIDEIKYLILFSVKCKMSHPSQHYDITWLSSYVVAYFIPTTWKALSALYGVTLYKVTPFVRYPFDYHVTLGFGSIAGGLDPVSHDIRLPIKRRINSGTRIDNIMAVINIDDLTIEQYLRLTSENQTPSMVKKVDDMTINKYIQYEERMKRQYSRSSGSYVPTYPSHNTTIECPSATNFNVIQSNIKFNYDSKDIELDEEAEYTTDEESVTSKHEALNPTHANDARSLNEELSSKEDLDEWLKGELEKHMKLNPRGFLLPFIIGNYSSYVMANIDASNNVMPRSICEYLMLDNLEGASISYEMDNLMQRETLDNVKNASVKIDKFEFLCDFVVTDMPGNLGEMIILGRPFLETIHAQIDVFYDDGSGEDCGMWLTCNPDSKFCYDFLQIHYENQRIDDTTHERRYYEWVAQNYDFDNNRTPSTTTVSDKCPYKTNYPTPVLIDEWDTRYHITHTGDTSNQNIPNNDPTPLSLEHSELRDKANISKSPKIQPFRPRPCDYSFDEWLKGQSFLCITKHDDDALRLGRVNGARFKAMIRKELKDKGQSSFYRHIDKRTNGDALRKCILEGPYQLTTVTIPAGPVTDDSPAALERTAVETLLNMSPENKEYYQSEKEAIHLLLIGIGDEIYSNVDACKTAHDIKFTSRDGESIESYYSRFYKMMNEMIRNNLTVSMMQYQKEVNEIRAERIAKNASPLALVAVAQQYSDPYYQAPKSHKPYAPTSKQSSSTRSNASTKFKGKEIAKPITTPFESAFEEDSDPEQA
ncbi:retrovirus-related pol polyprotein from transposon TNT 1-94 [Tanacetum coccineum]